MSWSIIFIGQPDNVANALQEISKDWDVQSKLEYESALPHLIAIVKENFGGGNPIVKINASGSGYAYEGKQTQRRCTVSIEILHGTLV